MNDKLLKIHSTDNVAVALADLSAGTVCPLEEALTITMQEDIPFGHKVAVTALKSGADIIKYGQPIGHATKYIAPGQHIHTQNLKTNLEGILDYSYNPDPERQQTAKTADKRYFDGYIRKNGKVGSRNEIWIIPTVGCVNTTASQLAAKATTAFGDKVDGVFAYTHNAGCSQLGDDMRCTQNILKGLSENPNAAGVLFLSLGCENNNLDEFIPLLGDYDPDRVKFLITQEVEDEYEAAMQLLGELADFASGFKREPVSVEHLTIGFKCGGSDAFSGITANALCGRITDCVSSYGGSTILTEVPEMFGAETLLMNRASSDKIFNDIVELINNFKEYFIRYGQEIYENPSPGNKKGGISTLEEKSLGCIQKGGQATVTGVLDYGDSICNRGLNLLTGSGNDQISCTNLVASGAQIVIFTTGRGNPFGSPVPTIKLASNSRLAARKQHWIDYNAGRLLEGETFQSLTDDFFSYILAVASGKTRTKNEENGYKEISIFRNGVIL